MRGLWIAAMILCATLLSAEQKGSQILFRIEGEPLVVTKLLQKTFASNAKQMSIHHFTTDTSISEIQIGSHDSKGFDLRRITDSLKERGVKIIQAKSDGKVWHLDLDMRDISIDFPLINNDSSAEMKRSTYPYWFDVSETKFVTIDPPYESEWYPELAIFNGNMEVLHSSRSKDIQGRKTYELPEGSKYLKVSNSHGMLLLKEGLWVSADQNED